MDTLFDLDFVDASLRVGIIKFAPGQSATVCLSSERVPVYEVHFIGRAFICPGDGCPACGTVAKRMHGFAVSGHCSNVQLVELGRPTILRMDEVRREKQITQLLGTTWRFSRSSHKRPLLPECIASTPGQLASTVSDQALMRAITRLYGLPSPGRDWTWDTFPSRIRETLHRQLRRALLGS